MNDENHLLYSVLSVLLGGKNGQLLLTVTVWENVKIIVMSLLFAISKVTQRTGRIFIQNH